MKSSLENNRPIVGDKVIASIYRKVRGLFGKHILHINSTSLGGGVAEMLQTLTSLINNTGINTYRRILHGNPDFFTITKKFHSTLQGELLHFSGINEETLYKKTSRTLDVILITVDNNFP